MTDKPGTDWTAKHNAAGQNAQPPTDRPCDAWPYTTISESDVTTNPNVNIVDKD